MGLLRFVLAAAVICWHSSALPGIALPNGNLAVEAFFVISGFYMALILDSKYADQKDGHWLFYSNRALRIFPMYYATLFFCLLLYTAGSIHLHHPVDRLVYWQQAAQRGDWWQLVLLALAQVFIVGIDISWMFSFSTQHGFVPFNGEPGTVPGWSFSFLPQAWSIGTELIFYAMAPWLVRRKCRILWILVAINVIAIVMVNTWWSTALTQAVMGRFFPFKLGYFLLGILAFRLFYQRQIPGLGSAALNWVVVALIALGCVSLGRTGGRNAELQMIFVTLIFLGIAFLFELTKRSKIDRLIGELSYPMYLCHIPLKWCVLAAVGVTHRGGTFNVPGILLVPLTVVTAMAMVKWIDYPVDRYRQWRAGAAKREKSVEAFPHGDLSAAKPED